MKKTKKRNRHKIPLVLAVAFILIFFSGVILYYRFDPKMLADISFYLDLANPYVKVVPVPEGLRKEEVADLVTRKLGWAPEAKEEFLKLHLAYNTADAEGMYYPKTYLLNKASEPTAVSDMMFSEFTKQFEKIESKQEEKITDRKSAMIIASIIQREAGSKSDMRLISGIIWNRLEAGMKLQMDATLQYAKGNATKWWPRVAPEDKNIKSQYNTYLNKGLPPGAIANPGLDAIYAAYNPQNTACLFYLHDRKGKIHCTRTYEEHKRNIGIYY